jgi:hypothetical protein
MVLRERALAFEAGGHRRLEQLGELLERAPGLRIVHALAGVDHRPLGGDEDLGCSGHVAGVRAAAQAWRGPVRERLGHLVGHDVARKLDQHWTRSPVADLRKRTAHDVRDVFRLRDLFDRLGDVAEVQERAEVRRILVDASGIAARQDHDRHRIAECLSHAAKRIFGAGATLHGEDANALGRRHTADRIGHVQANALLAHHDGPDVRPRGGLDDRINGIADQKVNALTFEDLSHSISRLHT